MSILASTHSLLHSYPKDISLNDAVTVRLRVLESSDQAALLAFFRSISPDDRWWLREDVSDAAVVRRWMTDLDYERVLPIIALSGNEIVADATLHRRGFGARQFTGEVRVVVAPAFRGRGLAYAMMAELVEVASGIGLRRLVAEIAVRAQAGALEAVEQFGFERVAVLPDLLDGPDGAPHDLIYLAYQLTGG